MKNLCTLLILASSCGWGYANLQPILSGSGCLYWPGTTPMSSACASSGALTVAAGGSNQNVVLAPTGTGVVNANGYLSFGGLFTALNAGHLRGDAHNFSNMPNTTIAIEDLDTAGGVAPSRLLRLQVKRRLLLLGQNLSTTDGTNWTLDQTGDPGVIYTANLAGGGSFAWGIATAGANPRTLTNLMILNGTGLSINTGAGAGFALDATGDVNASGVFRNGGTAGASASCTFCSITATGGIVTSISDGSSGVISVQSNVTASRAVGTVYQNTSGGPMFVLVSVADNTVPSTMQAFTDSSNPPTTVVGSQGNSTTGLNMSIGFWVLPNNYYKITESGGVATLGTWFEWH